MENIAPDDTIWNIFDQKLEVALLAVEVAASIRLRIEMGKGIELIRWLEGWNLRFKQQNKALISVVEDPGQLQCLEMSHPNLELLYITSINEIPKILLQLTQKHIPVTQNPMDDSNTITIQKEREQIHLARHTDTIIHNEHNSSVQSTSDRLVDSGAALRIIDEIKPELKNSKIHEPLSQSKADDSLSHAIQSESPATIPSKSAAPENTSKNGFGFISGKGIHLSQNTIVEISGEYKCDHCGMTRMFCKGDTVDKCENRECAFVHTSFTLQFDLF